MALAIQPRILKNFVLFVAGIGTAGRCDEVQIPSLDLMTEEHIAGGMDAPIKHDLGMRAIDLSFHMAEYDPTIISLFGVKAQESTDLIFRGHADDNAGNTEAIVIVARGQTQQIAPAQVRPGTKAGIQFTVNLVYYKMTVGGAVVVEIDIPNMKRIIGGYDQLAAMRANLGVS